ncbi:integrase [Pseudomonas phage Dolphis]|nr:integrase [Pseudomonas phage Dolphis]
MDNAKAPAKGDAWIWDSELEGFGIRIQASGRKTYLVRYRTKDASRTQRKMTLARCSDMPPDKARDLARKVFAQVADGLDPAAELKPTKAEVNGATVERMFQGYVASMYAKNQASASEVERVLLKAKNNAADALGRHVPALEVQPVDVVNYVSTYFKKGHRGAADKARSYIASAYNWAITSANDYTVPVEQRIDWGITRNPAADVAKDAGAIKTRDRNLDADELRELWQGTLNGNGGFSDEIAACVRILIACGQRVQETLRVEGSEIDLKAGLWKMPAEKTKGKKHPHIIPLPAVIIPTLEELIKKHGEGLLFPARTGSIGEIICHRSVNQALSRWLAEDEVNLQHFQTRDLRRTWKSRTADAGVDRFTRDLIQQHAKSDTGSKNYDRADYLPQMRDAMAKWSAWLGIVLSGGTPPAYGEPMIKVVA